MIHDDTTEIKSKQPAKPAKRLELLHMPGANAQKPWTGARYERKGAGAEIVTAQYATPREAADALIAIAQQTGLPVAMPAYLADSLIAEWEIDGIALHDAGAGPEACRNQYTLAGYLAARQQRLQRRRQGRQMERRQ